MSIRDGARRGEFRLPGSVEDAADRLISLMDGIAVRTLLGGLERDRMLKLLIGSLSLELGLDEGQRRRATRHAARRT
jgi:hypothetical protein